MTTVDLVARRPVHQHLDLVDREREAIREDWDHALAPNTRAAYRIQLTAWRNWCVLHDASISPAQPLDLRSWCIARAEGGAAMSSIRLGLSAIANVHRANGMDNPAASPVVTLAIKRLAREHARPQRQAHALTDDVLRLIRADAERQGQVLVDLEGLDLVDAGALHQRRRRARVAAGDVALGGLLRDGLLRRSELAAATWADLSIDDDAGHGILMIRKSKVDQLGEGAAVFLSRQTITDLLLVWPRGKDNFRIIGLSAGQLGRRLRAAGERVGISGLTAHGGRIGMAVDLMQAGASLAELMAAGRWSSPTMVSRYTKAAAAESNAVAKWHASRAP